MNQTPAIFYIKMAYDVFVLAKSKWAFIQGGNFFWPVGSVSSFNILGSETCMHAPVVHSCWTQLTVYELEKQ